MLRCPFPPVSALSALPKTEDQEACRTRGRVPLLPESLCWSTIFSCIFNWSLQLHHHPSPKEIHHDMIKWLQAWRPDVCGYEVFWKSGVEPPEWHHRPPVCPVCLLGKQTGQGCSQYGTWLRPATPRPTWDISHYALAFRLTFNPPLKAPQFTVPVSTYQWITSFLLDRQQPVRLRSISACPRGVLSPCCSSPSTDDCASGEPSIILLKLVADTSIIVLIQNGDESVYRWEVDWCSQKYLELSLFKTVEMTMDFLRNLPTIIVLSSSKILSLQIPGICLYTQSGPHI